MSNKRIDVTQYERLTEDGLRGGDTVWRKDVNHKFTAPYVLGLIAELKRMYKLEDDYRHLLNQYWLDEGWIATCKADGEGECSLEIETLDKLMELVANETVEIPEYSHSSDELILYDEHCTCGVSHEEWMISTGRASE